ncbi:MAG: hypothetical protein AB3N15_17790 [Paracoccaceae bacterium]
MDLTRDKTTILLHMGIHKTGSTSLQASFTKHRQLLQAKDIQYLGEDGPYKNLYSAFLSDPMRYEWNRRSKLDTDQIRQRDQDTISELRDLLSRCQGQTIILSSEFLPLLHLAEMRKLRDFLTPYGTVQAVYFYREIDSWIASDSQQLAKVGLATKPTEFNIALSRIRELPLRVAEVFGQDNTTFIRFEDAIKSGICNTFLSSFGLPTLSQLGGEEVVANQSISGAAAEAMFDYNQRFPPGNRNRDPKEVAKIIAIPGEKYRGPMFSPEEIAQYAQARKEVSDRLGLRLQSPRQLQAFRTEATGLFGRALQAAERRMLKLLGKTS